MKAFVNSAYKQTFWTESEKPHVIKPTDALVKIKMFTFSQQDYALHYDASTKRKPLVMGHEGIGTIVACGSDVKLQEKSEILIHGITVCGCCALCVKSNNKLCQRYGFWHGVVGAGTHAQYCLVPYADLNLTVIPKQLDRVLALLCCDTLSTIYTLVFRVLEHDCDKQTMAVVGNGAIALATVVMIKTWLPHFKIDLYVKHASQAQTVKHLVNKIVDVTQTKRFADQYDVVVEAVGNEKKLTLPLCQKLLAYDGLLLVLGVFEHLNLDGYDVLYKNNTLKHGIVHYQSMPDMLAKLLTSPLPFDLLVNPHYYQTHAINDAYQQNKTNDFAKNVCVID